MNAWLPDLNDGLDYDAETDSFSTRYDPDIIETSTGIDIDSMHLYPIGNGSWTWTTIEEKNGCQIPRTERHRDTQRVYPSPWHH